MVIAESRCRLAPTGKTCQELRRSTGTFYRSDAGSELEKVAVGNGSGTLRDASTGKAYRIFYGANEAQQIGTFRPVSYRAADVRVIASKRINGRDCVATAILGDRVRNGYKWIDTALDLVVKREWEMLEDDGTWIETVRELTDIQTGAGIPPELFRVPSGFRVTNVSYTPQQ